jgi:hypothetical protein
MDRADDTRFQTITDWPIAMCRLFFLWYPHIFVNDLATLIEKWMSGVAKNPTFGDV